MRPAALLLVSSLLAAPLRGEAFDHSYGAYAAFLTSVVRGPRVDYQQLVARKGERDRVAAAFGAPTAADERGWSRAERLAFWINAYNVFTLKAIADRYPIRSRWFTLLPRNSIRQIDGVWTDLRFPAASREVTLDDIEHRILRPEFQEPRIHFAINCASVSCPPLREEPYTAAQLETQLDDAARRYLASPLGLQVNGDTLRVTSIFKWYGTDFVPAFARTTPGTRPDVERAILGVVAAFAPDEARHVAAMPQVRVRYLDYDWSLNDVVRERPTR